MNIYQNNDEVQDAASSLEIFMKCHIGEIPNSDLILLNDILWNLKEFIKEHYEG